MNAQDVKNRVKLMKTSQLLVIILFLAATAGIALWALARFDQLSSPNEHYIQEFERTSPLDNRELYLVAYTALRLTPMFQNHPSYQWAKSLTPDYLGIGDLHKTVSFDVVSASREGVTVRFSGLSNQTCTDLSQGASLFIPRPAASGNSNARLPQFERLSDWGVQMTERPGDCNHDTFSVRFGY